MFMEVIFLWSVFRFTCLTLYICFLSLFFTLPVFAPYSRFLLCKWSVCWLVQKNPVLSRFSASHGVFLRWCVIWLVLWMVNRLFLGTFCRLVWFFGWLQRIFPCRYLPAGIFRFFQAAAKDFDGGFSFGQFLLDSAGLVRYEVTTCFYIGQAVFG